MFIKSHQREIIRFTVLVSHSNLSLLVHVNLYVHVEPFHTEGLGLKLNLVLVKLTKLENQKLKPNSCKTCLLPLVMPYFSFPPSVVKSLVQSPAHIHKFVLASDWDTIKGHGSGTWQLPKFCSLCNNKDSLQIQVFVALVFVLIFFFAFCESLLLLTRLSWLKLQSWSHCSSLCGLWATLLMF